MSEKIYKVQMNSKGMPNFSTAVEVEDRPQGEWVFVEEFMGINRYKCSACEREELRTHLSNFCPNCGARMFR